MDSRSGQGVERVAVAVERHGQRGGPDPDTLECIRRTVEAWPPLTAEECDRIALLLLPEPGRGAPRGGGGASTRGAEPTHSGG